MSETKTMLRIKDVQQRLGVGRSSTYRLLEGEPGVHRIYTTGSTKPMIVVEPEVVERILRRSATQPYIG
jgi:hypothetical protein